MFSQYLLVPKLSLSKPLLVYTEMRGKLLTIHFSAVVTLTLALQTRAEWKLFQYQIIRNKTLADDITKGLKSLGKNNKPTILVIESRYLYKLILTGGQNLI